MKGKIWVGVASVATLAACTTVAPLPQPAGRPASDGVIQDGQVYPTGNTYRVLATDELPIAGVTTDSAAGAFPAADLIDGDLASQWANGGYLNATAWAAVQLSVSTTIASVGIKTGPSAAGTSYDVQVSADGANWTTVLSRQTNSTWGLETKTLPSGTTGKYVRIFWHNSATNPVPHFAIFELQVNGVAGPAPGPMPSPAPSSSPVATPAPGTAGNRLIPTGITADSSYGGTEPGDAIDGDLGSQWVNGGYKNPEADLTLSFPTTETFGQVKLKTGALPEGVTYKFDVSNDGVNWQPASGRMSSSTWALETKGVVGQGRYLRLRFLNGAEAPIAHFQVFEIEVYAGSGTSVITDPTPRPTSTPAQTGSGQFYPDLLAVPADSFYLQNTSSGTELHFPTMIANVGAGNFQLRSDVSGNVSDAYQEILDFSGRVVQSEYVGQFEYEAEHGHTHFENVARYELRQGSPFGTLVRTSNKVSFCMEDSLRYLPSSVASQYGDCTPTLMGITRSFADLYTASVPGQTFNVSGLPAGEYYVVIHIDPTGMLLESSRSNNMAWTKIFLSPGTGSVNKLGTSS